MMPSTQPNHTPQQPTPMQMESGYLSPETASELARLESDSSHEGIKRRLLHLQIALEAALNETAKLRELLERMK